MVPCFSLGPIAPGGTIFVLGLSPDVHRSPATYAATSTGLYLCLDSGGPWTLLTGASDGQSVQALALSLQFGTDRTLLAGYASSIARSTDAGKTWSHTSLGGRASEVTALALSPRFAQDGVALAGTAGDGILRSTDGGRTWNRASFGLLDLGVTALATSPDWSGEELAFAATEAGLHRTVNGGRAWRLVEGETEDLIGLALALSPGSVREQMVLLGTEGAGVWRSLDRGRTWQSVGLPDQVVNCVAFSLRFDSDRTVYAGTTARGFWRSQNAGDTWTAVGAEMPPVLSLGVAEDRILAGTYRHGIYSSADCGHTWVGPDPALVARSVMWLQALDDANLVAAGPDVGLMGSVDGGVSWHEAGSSPTGDVHCLAHGPGGRLFVGTSDGVIRTGGLGMDWAPVPGSDAWGSVTCIRSAAPYSTGDALWAGTTDGVLYASLDGGESWSLLSDALSGEQIMDVQPIGGQTTALLASTLSVGADGGALVRAWFSADGGRRWRLSVAADSASRWLAYSFSPGTDYVLGVGNTVLRSRDGLEWERGLIVEARSVTVLSLASATDPWGASWLVAGTNQGLYVSRAKERDWRAVDCELAGRPVLSLSAPPAGHPLYALTPGGSVWRVTLP